MLPDHKAVKALLWGPLLFPAPLPDSVSSFSSFSSHLPKESESSWDVRLMQAGEVAAPGCYFWLWPHSGMCPKVK